MNCNRSIQFLNFCTANYLQVLKEMHLRFTGNLQAYKKLILHFRRKINKVFNKL